jgi:hypothetical protein
MNGGWRMAAGAGDNEGGADRPGEKREREKEREERRTKKPIAV